MSPSDAAYQKLLAELAALREKAERVCAEMRETVAEWGRIPILLRNELQELGFTRLRSRSNRLRVGSVETNLALRSASALDGLQACRDWTAQLAPPPCRPAVAEDLDVRFTDGLEAMDNVNCPFQAAA